MKVKDLRKDIENMDPESVSDASVRKSIISTEFPDSIELVHPNDVEEDVDYKEVCVIS